MCTRCPTGTIPIRGSRWRASRGSEGVAGQVLRTLAGAAHFLAAIATPVGAVTPLPQQATDVVGRLVDASTGVPVEGALVAIPAVGASTLSDADGAFRLAGVLDGAHTFEVRHIAYGTRTGEVQVRGGGTLSLELRLEPVVLGVEPLEVEIEWRPAYLERVGFYDRQAEGIGEFYDPAFVQRWGVGTWAAAPNLIREIILARGRGGGSLACGGPQVIIDGRLDRSGLITTLSATGIGAVEVYNGAYKVPDVVKEARPDPFCTTVIIWTRQWLNEYELERRRIVLCEPEEVAGPPPLVVEGTVMDSLTEVILPRSTVTAWITEPGGTRREQTTTADDNGRYRFCELDPRGDVNVWASFAGLSGGLAPVVPADTTIVVRDLTIPISRPGHLVGRATGRARGRSVVAAEIRLEGTDYTLTTTDEHGFFEIRELSPGDYRLLITHPETGSAGDSIFIVSGSTTDVRAELSSDPEAPSRILVSRRDPRLESIGFYARRAESTRLGQGYFLTREEIEEMDSERVTDLLEGVSAVREICVGRGCRIVSSQTISCPRVPIYLDGALRVDSRGADREEEDVDRLVTPAELVALEVYARPVSLSGRFAPPSHRCGAIVLWSGG